MSLYGFHFTLDSICLEFMLKLQVVAFSRKASDSDPPFLAVQNIDKDKQKRVLSPEKCSRKRKGKPFRAPLF